VRFEPRTLADVVVSSRTPENENPVAFLRAAIERDRPPLFMVLWSEQGGLGKTSVVRAFARDYFRKKQAELEAAGSTLAVVNPRGGPESGWYLEVPGDALADSATRELLRNFIRTPGGFGESTQGVSVKHVLVLEDVDRIPPTTISFLKDVLQAGRADVDQTTVARNNIVFATSNRPDFLIDTPLGSRAIKFRVYPLFEAQVVEYLQAVATAESLTCPGDYFAAVAKAVNGSLRDALNDLDKAITEGRCQA